MRYFYYSTVAKNAQGEMIFNFDVLESTEYPTIKALKDHSIGKGAINPSILSISELSEADKIRFTSEQ